MGNDSSGDRADGGGVQSVDRAISILEILSRRREAGVSEVAGEIGVHKSTAFRLLGALETRGLVEQAEDRGKYRLSFGIIRLAGGVAARLDLTQQSRPVCRRLAEEIGETVNLAVLRSHYAVNLDQVRGPSAVTTQNWVGQLTPLHATSSGKVLLAHLDGRHRARLIAAAGLEGYTPATITSAAVLEEQLEEALRRGYAVTVEELEIGLNAIAAPVRSHDGEIVAAVSASGPAYRLSQERMHGLAPVLTAGAEDISRRLGYTARS
ncbi:MULTISPECIES: IclR family transcriptional regulator [Streptosporangium]|uniref:DNA-binding IclR family transcriptional regulator n=1 Tax=Streptosporangium brasiliense TaxID=47480 RepID=A0ABT9RN20_9ACTN|nr:IclR family transcriptional regulator [Streptosporangium brasiliense]MDP9870109.1 DNA-binding IclR family transcriptional regulator [Streptosporangium brasiliense]